VLNEYNANVTIVVFIFHLSLLIVSNNINIGIIENELFEVVLNSDNEKGKR
jgi:hypothetical protein